MDAGPIRRSIALALALVAILGALSARAGTVAEATTAPAAWPPPLGEGSSAFDFIHYGEGHYDEGQGRVINGHIVEAVNAYRPAFLAFSSDMDTVGTSDNLEGFRRFIEEGFAPESDRCPDPEIACFAGLDPRVPWYDSPGNHDRDVLAGPGGVLGFSSDAYRQVFAHEAQPWGDAPFHAGFSGGPEHPAGEGAFTHYWVDYGSLRLIVLDNSCHSFTVCNALQSPAFGPSHPYAGQLGFLVETAQEAAGAGKLVFVMMHQPTTDPRDPTNVAAISVNHSMSKGVTTDNAAFETLAAATGVDGVLVGHIKGNWVYESAGVPYYIDGGGGGIPYARTAVGVDTGFWYGYRLFRVDGTSFGSWLVPIVERIEVTSSEQPVGPSITVQAGETLDLDATAFPPQCECTDDPWRTQMKVELREPQGPAGFESSIPSVSYVWHTSDPAVLSPDGGASVEPGFDPLAMSKTGRFTAVAPGTATVTIVTGWARHSVTVEVVAAL